MCCITILLCLALCQTQCSWQPLAFLRIAQLYFRKMYVYQPQESYVSGATENASLVNSLIDFYAREWTVKRLNLLDFPVQIRVVSAPPLTPPPCEPEWGRACDTNTKLQPYASHNRSIIAHITRDLLNWRFDNWYQNPRHIWKPRRMIVITLNLKLHYTYHIGDFYNLNYNSICSKSVSCLC